MELLAGLILLLVIALLWACANGWFQAAQSLGRGEPLVPFEPREEPPWGLVDIVIAAALFLVVGPLIAGTTLQGIFGVELGVPIEELAPGQRISVLTAGALIGAGTFVVSILVLKLRTGWSVSRLGIVGSPFVSDVLLGGKAFVMIAPPVYAVQFVLVQFLPSEHPLIEVLKEDPDPMFFVLAGLSAVIVAPIVEEYLFRLLLQGWLERLFGYDSDPTTRVIGGEAVVSPSSAVAEKPLDSTGSATTAVSSNNPYEPPPDVGWNAESKGAKDTSTPTLPAWPILVSAVLFAVAHWSHGPDPVPLFILALGLGYLYQRTHRLVPCIVLHMLLNAASLVALWVSLQAGA